MIAKIRSKDAKFDPPTPSQRRDPCNPKRQALAKVWGLSSIGQWIWVPCCFGDCVPKKILNSTKPGWEEPSRSSPKARANNTTHLSLSCTGWWCQPSQLYKHSKIGRYIFQLTLTLFPRVLTVLSADIYIYMTIYIFYPSPGGAPCGLAKSTEGRRSASRRSSATSRMPKGKDTRSLGGAPCAAGQLIVRGLFPLVSLKPADGRKWLTIPVV